MPLDADRAQFTAQSELTDPGPHGHLFEALPGDLEPLRRTAQNLVFHYHAGGDHAANGITPDRLAEIDLRYTDLMLGRLAELADQPLDEPRRPAERVVGCCRDFTLLLVAMARHKGYAARSRVGFARYFIPGWFLDHVVAEIWDAEEGRWRLVEPEIDPGHQDPADGAPIDPLDVPRDRFLPAPLAWQACRAGRLDPERFVVGPELDEPALRSWPYLAHNLVHDLAALNRREMVLWDDWGATRGPGPHPAPLLSLLDELAALTAQPDPGAAELAAWLARPEFRIPEEVTSHSPAARAWVRVPLTRR